MALGNSRGGAQVSNQHGSRGAAAQWKAIFWRIYNKFNDDRLLAIAGGVVFYGLLALVPALTTLVALYGFFADPSTVASHLALSSSTGSPSTGSSPPSAGYSSHCGARIPARRRS